MAKFCSNCGKTVDENVAYCESCGNALINTQATSHHTKRNTKMQYSIPAFVNGVLAVVFGIIGMIYVSVTPVSGMAVAQSSARIRVAYKAYQDAGDRMALLIGFGVLLIITGVITLFIKPTKINRILTIVIWVVPLAITVLFTLINYIPIFGFTY